MQDSKNVLLLAPYGRDADSLAAIVQELGYRAEIFRSMAALAARLDDTTGVVVLTEEAIGATGGLLADALRRQEPWSDIPFVLLRAPRSPGLGGRTALPEEVLNVIELERPLSASVLASAVTAGQRSRQKQFVIRDQVLRLEVSQAALAASEAELRLIADALPVLIAFIDTALVYRFANLAYEDWFGMPIAHIIGRKVGEVMGPQAWHERVEAMGVALSGRPVRMELSWPHRDGRRRDAEIRYLPRFAADGTVDGFHVFATDVTVRKVALEATQQQAAVLEARVAERTAELEQQMAARESSEAALRQAQKMEAVGQLTGGIAHDFNNMLTGILAAMDLMRMRIDEGRFDNLDRFMSVATTSAQRAAGLTQRLLAFSRRQSLDPRAVEVNAMVRSVEDLLTRTLGERVRLRTDLHEGLPSALVDTNQLESALLNLAINARDAMPDGGELRIATALAHLAGEPSGAAASSGPYVRLSVGDTGVGMDGDVLSRVFEPFYTTKPLGQGTGLGMSMIYGFIQQSEGHIRIDSTPGQGTTVELYLPLAAEGEGAPLAEADGVVVGGHGQRIVLVEDDAQVRVLTSELLTELGYHVDAAETADGALGILASLQPVDLLVTDVGLPGLNGRQLAEIVRQTRPALPILFMTGYAEGAAVRSEFLEAGMTMIAKPFNVDVFSQTVGRILAEGGNAPSDGLS
ncbi:hybrid sensor histidine kinase/response regulator [Luteibacter sp. 9135]|uniref:hybrid sensor histidine kinase/response regulator n=1 Tax=Luteibacter sp. 9135 TaxID=1500893 RepID=UPI00068A6192|nr:ATP-binding protein [Luteibacter sp. 9135]